MKADESGHLSDAPILMAEEETFTLGDDRPTPESILDACDQVEALAVSEPGLAERRAAELVHIADLAGDPRIQVRARRALAQASAYSGKFEAALQHCQNAIAIGTGHGLIVETARARMASLHALASLGRFREAIDAGLAAREELATECESELIARVELNLGAVCAMNDDPATALMYFERARPAFIAQTAILAQLETNRGNALAALDDYSGATAAFATAVASFELAQQPLAAAIAEGNRGYLAARRGLIQQALAHFERARRMLDESGARSHRARLVAEYADVIATLGLTADAADLLTGVLPDLDNSSQRVEAARARVALARTFIARLQFERAEVCLREAISTFQDVGQTIDLYRAQMTMARLALHQGDPGMAVGMATEARTGLSDRPADAALADTVVARAYLVSGDYGKAIEAIEKALTVARKLELAPIEAEAHLLKGKWLQARGEPALAEFSTAVQLTEHIRGTLQAGVFRSAFHDDQIAPYNELLSAAVSMNDETSAGTAFQAGELIKSRTLMDLIDGRHGAHGIDIGQQSAQEQELRLQLGRIREELNWQYSRFSSATETHTAGKTRVLEAEAQRLETRLAATSTSITSGETPVTLAETLDLLPAETAAISFSAIGDEIVAFVLHGGDCIVVRSLATTSEINAHLRRFRLQVARVHAHGGNVNGSGRLLQDARRELQAFHTLLVEPIIQHIPTISHLVIAPVGPLHMVPFAALWNGIHYLTEQFTLNVVPSLSIYSRLVRSPQNERRGPSLLVGVADEFAPHLTDEIEVIKQLMRQHHVLLGEDATCDRVKEFVPGAVDFHFACHGRFSRDFPQASGLKLSDRWLSRSEIAALDFRGAHITLSACDTGKSAQQGVEEFIGLSSGFLAAGARSLILSLWPADDLHTVTIMSDCYESRQAGESFAGSLRKAQLNAIRSGIHPAHWAPFTFGGRA